MNKEQEKLLESRDELILIQQQIKQLLAGETVRLLDDIHISTFIDAVQNFLQNRGVANA